MQNFRSAAGYELRNNGDDMPTLEIVFARFNVWSEIYSYREGRFLERISPGAFADTFAERAGRIKCLFNHGRDVTIGDKPLGTVSNLRESNVGPVADVALFDAGYVRDILPGLQSDPPVYGASYRFGVFRSTAITGSVPVVGELWNREPGVSAHNPDGLPERTLTRVNVSEFGPVTFPADEGTHGLTSVRSLETRFGSNDLDSEEPAAGAPGPEQNRDRAATAFALARHKGLTA